MRDRVERNFGRRRRELDLLSFGYLLVLMGFLWILNPGLPGDLIGFLKDFRLVRGEGGIYLPAPMHGHPSLYLTAMRFCLAYGAFQALILVLRVLQGEPLDAKAGTASRIAFWLAMGFFLRLMVEGILTWLGLIAGFIISVGLSITVSNLIKLLRR